jgi:hypothetical protein
MDSPGATIGEVSLTRDPQHEKLAIKCIFREERSEN